MSEPKVEPAWQWLRSIEAVQVDGDLESQTAEVETLVVVLSGTYDILAGGGSWLARGIRETPRDGKPVALFLPPKTRFAFQNGQGEILFVSGIQPKVEKKVGEETSQKPLLPLAGSGKAFDPATGEWKREEDFPSSPEAILPRRIEVTESEGAVLRHVFPFEYKALSLSLDEAVLDAGATISAPSIPDAIPEGGDYPAERAVFYDTEGELRIGESTVTGRGVVASVPADTEITAGESECYLAFAYAGKKL